jgi:16S rRNA A1518/A1519 N6-dimethyltransferase RsmA/KsgA/DIM1 with predicted DNA glycosylase/AP lyase activity
MKIDINIPDGKSGIWEVKTFTVTEDEAQFACLRAMLHGGRGGVKPGIYKKLTRNGRIVMSNTPDEIRDQLHFLHIANGIILINGLGLGITLQGLLNKPDVKQITVIEKEKDVIKLIVPYIKDERVNFINDDALKYSPPKNAHYDFVWHDIWDNITPDNLPEMTKLHRKYGKKADYQDSWCRSLCLKAKKNNS